MVSSFFNLFSYFVQAGLLMACLVVVTDVQPEIRPEVTRKMRNLLKDSDYADIGEAKTEGNEGSQECIWFQRYFWGDACSGPANPLT
jgi:hypothetical protein